MQIKLNRIKAKYLENSAVATITMESQAIPAARNSSKTHSKIEFASIYVPQKLIREISDMPPSCKLVSDELV